MKLIEEIRELEARARRRVVARASLFVVLCALWPGRPAVAMAATVASLVVGVAPAEAQPGFGPMSDLEFRLKIATGSTRVDDDQITKYGGRSPLGNSALQTIWPGPTDIRPLPPSALLMTVQSTDLDDAQGDTGARQVLVKCLDAAYFRFQEVVLLDGTTPVAMVAPCLRIWRIQILDGDVGSTGTNEGDVTVENGGVVYGFIEALAGSSQVLAYTVPAQRALMIRSILIGSDDKTRNVFWFDAPGVAPASLAFQLEAQLTLVSNICLPAQTDFEIRSQSAAGNAEVGGIMSLILVTKTSGKCFP